MHYLGMAKTNALVLGKNRGFGRTYLLNYCPCRISFCISVCFTRTAHHSLLLGPKKSHKVFNLWLTLRLMLGIMVVPVIAHSIGKHFLQAFA